MRLKKIDLQDVLVSLLVIFIILDCASVYMNLIGFQYIQILADLVLVFITLIELANFERKLKVNKIGFEIILYFLVVMIILITFGNFAMPSFVAGCVVPIVLFLLLFTSKRGEILLSKLLKRFCDVVMIISVVSLFFYVFGTILKTIPPQLHYTANQIEWGGYGYNGYFGIYFEGQNALLFSYVISRNIGIFLEAPAYAYVLLCALYLELFWIDAGWKRPAILLVTIITTFSTSGYCIGLILVFIKIYFSYMKKSIWKLLVPVLIVVVYFVAVNMITDKFAVQGASGDIRFDDMIACFKCFCDNPFVGVGFNQAELLRPYRSSFRQIAGAGMSMGIPYIFATGGITFASLYVIPLIKAIGSIRIKDYNVQLVGLAVSQFVMLFVLVFQSTILAELFLTVSWVGLFASKNLLHNQERKINGFELKTNL